MEYLGQATKKDIRNDTTERFVDLPGKSDGQLLFAQHILYHLDNNGIAAVVHNGSAIFSGDAGGGESNIRKHFFDNDWVEAIIQMPSDEFFNTPIHTYLWIFNKNKPPERKDKVILIDSSKQWEQLKKSKGKKRRKMNVNHRLQAVNSLVNFQESNYAKVFDKWHFYYNKQAIMLTNVDEEGNSIDLNDKKSIKLNPSKLTYDFNDEFHEITEFVIEEFEDDNCKKLKEYYDQVLKPKIANIDYKESNLKVVSEGVTHWYDTDKETIIEDNGEQTALGCGKVVVKASYKKATKTKKEHIAITVELTKNLEKDYEIIPYSPDEATNQQNIADFIAKYVNRPFEYLDNVIGVEISFNKIFYQPEQLRKIDKITSDLGDLENELKKLQAELAL